MEQAIHQRRPAQDQMAHHSDRRSQYLSIKYAERLAEAKIAPSVGSVGDSYDNALAETINGLFKAEVIQRRGPWRNFEAVEYATLEWIDWFNNRRLLEPIGNIPPAEVKANLVEVSEAPSLSMSFLQQQSSNFHELLCVSHSKCRYLLQRPCLVGRLTYHLWHRRFQRHSGF